jgi:hypothetical protein
MKGTLPAEGSGLDYSQSLQAATANACLPFWDGFGSLADHQSARCQREHRLELTYAGLAFTGIVLALAVVGTVWKHRKR